MKSSQSNTYKESKDKKKRQRSSKHSLSKQLNINKVLQSLNQKSKMLKKTKVGSFVKKFRKENRKTKNRSKFKSQRQEKNGNYLKLFLSQDVLEKKKSPCRLKDKRMKSKKESKLLRHKSVKKNSTKNWKKKAFLEESQLTNPK